MEIKKIYNMYYVLAEKFESMEHQTPDGFNDKL